MIGADEGDPAEPGPEDVAEALQHGIAPSALLPDEIPGRPAVPTPVRPSDDAVTGGGLQVRTVGPSLLFARQEALDEAVGAGVPAALARKDPTLWGADATAGASARLGWLDAVAAGRAVLPELLALGRSLAEQGLDRVVLAAGGGRALAAEAVCAATGRPLVVLDSTDPGQVRAALTELDRTVVVCVDDEAGLTDAWLRAAGEAFSAAGVEAAERVVVVARAGSSLAEQPGRRALFLADPQAGERYTALGAQTLVPAALAGADVAALLEQAAALHDTLADPAGPALALGAAVGGGAVAGRDKLVLAGPAGLGEWVEHLVAGSTGKQRRGVVPVVVEAPEAPSTEPALDLHLLVFDGPAEPLGTSVTGPLGAQLLAWEYATAVAARALHVDPFDTPDVPDLDADALLAEEAGDTPALLLREGPVELYGAGLGDVDDLAHALDALLHAVPPRGHLAVTAHLDRYADARAAGLRAALGARLAHPVTFGWGQRSGSATLQLHRGGPQLGVFLQVTGSTPDDLAVPGRPYTFGGLQAARAAEELRALTARGRPVLRVHLTDRGPGLDALLAAALAARSSGAAR